MDFKDIQEEVKKIESGGKGNPEVIYFQDDTEAYIRLIPINEDLDESLNVGDQFVRAWVHYKSGGVVPETTFSPKTFGEIDPVEDFIALALREVVSKPRFKQYMNMKPKEVYITTAVVRGEEEAGTKLLTLSTGQFKQFMNDVDKSFRVAEKDITKHDISDPENGFDILVDCKGKDPKNNKSYRSFSYGINAHKAKPLAVDGDTLSNILENQPDWRDAYGRIDVNKLEGYLESAMEMGDDDDFEVEDEDDNANATHQKYDTKVSDDDVIESASKDLQKMMGKEPEPEIVGEDEDDLPF